MTILWHSVKYPPKKDGMYYVKAQRYRNGVEYWGIDTYFYTVAAGWNTFYEIKYDDHGKPYQGRLMADNRIEMSEDRYWAEVERVSD